MYLWIDHLEIDSKTNFNAEREGKNPYSRNMFSIFTFHQFFFFSPIPEQHGDML